MGFYRFFCRASTRALIGAILITSFLASPAYSLDTKDSQLFITGFNAYLKRDYPEAIANLSEVLEKYPDTSLRDMAILWLSRSYYKSGNQQDAARYMAQFFKEYPESPLKGTVEDELTELAAKYQKGESLATQQAAKTTAPPQVPAKPDESVRITAEKAAAAKAEADRQAAEKLALAKAEADRQAAEKVAFAKAEADRLEAEKLALAKAEADRLEAEKLALAKAEAERLEAEKLALAKAEADRLEAEKLALAKAEAERLEAEKLALAKAEADRLEAEKRAAARAEAERLEAENIALAKAEAERQEAEKLAQAKVEADRLAAERRAAARAEAERLEAEKFAQAEADRLATERLALAQAEAERQEAENLAQAKVEADRLAAARRAAARAEAERLEAENIALAKAEADRLEAEKFAQAEADRLAAERLALAQAEAERQEAEKLAQAKVEADRLAAENLAKAEADRQAAEQLALTKAEADRREAERLFFAKSAADRLEAEKRAAARAEAERLEAENIALAKTEAKRQESEKLAQAKAAADRQEAEQRAAARAEAERLEAEKLAQAKAEADRQEAERLAQAKAVFVTGFNAYLRGDYPGATENLTVVLEKYPDTSLQDVALLWLSRSYYKAGNQQDAGRYMARLFNEYPESPLNDTVEGDLAELAAKYQRGEPLAQQPARTDIAQEDEAVRIAAEKSARDKAEQGRAAAARAEADRQTAAMLSKAEAARQAKADAETKLAVAASQQSTLKASQSRRFREQAIAEYQSVVARYPGTPAAANAAIRLRELGALPQAQADTVAASMGQSDENIHIFSIVVDQKANLEFNLAAEAQTVEIGTRFSMPFEVLNLGNSPDIFTLESGIPAEYRPRFVADADPDFPLVKTSELLPGDRFKGLLQFEMPTMSLDGERKLFPVKAQSDADGAISQSRPLRLLAKAPILRAVIKSDITQAAPGERIPYRLALLNVGSSAAREVSLRITFPPQYEPVDATAAGFRLDGNNALVISGLQLNQGDRRELAVTMQLKDSALAKEELFLHADMINTSLNRTDTFVSAPVAVKAISGVRMLANVEKIIAIPGQTVPVLLAVTNTGNASDDFTLKPSLASNLNYSFYLDANRDGTRQAEETIVSHVGPLAPGEVVNLILEITTSAAEKDGAAVPLQIALDSQSDPSKRASAKLSLLYSRPVLNLTVAGRGGKIRPGEVNTFELVCINAGSSMAKMVEIRSSLPDQLELVADEPGNANKSNGEYAWRFDELGSGEKRTVRVSYRIKSGTAVGTALALKNVLKYQDQLGNSY